MWCGYLFLFTACILLSKADDQLTALTDLYHSTNGAYWNRHDNWLMNANYCNGWDGVTCSGSTVIQLALVNNNLTGTLPASLGLLTGLQNLQLQTNPNLGGPLPASFVNMTQLQDVYLFACNLSGPIPTDIGNLVQLQDLQIQQNMFSGTVPESYCNLVNLTAIKLFGNQLSGQFPDCIGSLTKVTDFSAQNNYFTGHIPTTIGSLVLLTVLDFTNSVFSGTLPDNFGALTLLSGFNLGSGQFSGNIPSNIGSMVSLITLNLSDNKFNGSIPSSICQMNSLKGLFLNNNQLTGAIPSCIGNMISLTELNLQTNQLSGDFPASISQLVNLQYVYMFTNQISGSLPSDIGDLNQMIIFQIQGNNIGGVLPSSMSQMINMQSLMLWDNNFSGNLPNFGTMTNIQYLQFHVNQLTGPLPDLSACKQLKSFIFYSNRLTGQLPYWLVNIPELQGADNYFTSANLSLPTVWGSGSACYLGGNYLSCDTYPNATILNQCNIPNGTPCFNPSAPSFFPLNPPGDLQRGLGKIANVVNTFSLSSAIVVVLNSGTFTTPGDFIAPNCMLTLSPSSGVIFGPGSSLTVNVSSLFVSTPLVYLNNTGDNQCNLIAKQATFNSINMIGCQSNTPGISMSSVNKLTINFFTGTNNMMPSVFSASGNMNSVTLTSGNFSDNSGQAVLLTGPTIGSVSVTSSTFLRNSGGGVKISATGPVNSVNFYNTQFRNNTTPLDGAGISVTSTTSQISSFVLQNSNFSRNTARNGGAVYIFGQNSVNGTTIYNASLTQNTASLGGGAVHIEGGAIGYVSVNSSKFLRNKATGRTGGGVDVVSTGVVKSFYTNSFFQANSANTNGGSISVGAKSVYDLTVDDSSVYNCSAGNGGGLSLVVVGPSSVNVTGTFQQNSAGSSGGAIYLSGPVTANFYDLSMANNNATQGGSLQSTNVTGVTVSNSSFATDYASSSGGSVYISTNTGNNDVITIASSVFNGSVAQNMGGALMLVTGTSTSGKRQQGTPILVVDSQFYRNSAADGGSMFISGNADVTDSTFSQNTASRGSALYVGGSNTVRVSGNNYNNDQIYIGQGVLLSETLTGLFLTCQSGQPNITNGVITCPVLVTSQTTTITMNTSTSGDDVVGNLNENNNGGKSNIGPIIGGVIGGVALIMLIAVILFFVLRRKNDKEIAEISAETPLEMAARRGVISNKNAVIKYEELTGMKQIGRGAFGVVYRADWRQIDVAVKQLLNMDTLTTKEVEAFFDEVALLQNLRAHPNVVVFMGITMPPDPTALVIEFCENGSLLDYLLDAKEKISPEDKKKFISGTALGMYHLHTENIIHRDLATRNILLSSSLEPKISDFGLSRKTESSDSASQTTSNVGPLKWMAPEAIMHKQYSGKSDVFSFSMTMWEILSNGAVLYGEDVTPVNAAIMVTTQQARPEISEEMASEYPRLVSIMKACWVTDPQERPSFKTIVGWLKEDTKSEVLKPEFSPIERKREPDDGTNYAMMDFVEAPKEC